MRRLLASSWGLGFRSSAALAIARASAWLIHFISLLEKTLSLRLQSRLPLPKRRLLGFSQCSNHASRRPGKRFVIVPRENSLVSLAVDGQLVAVDGIGALGSFTHDGKRSLSTRLHFEHDRAVCIGVCAFKLRTAGSGGQYRQSHY